MKDFKNPAILQDLRTQIKKTSYQQINKEKYQNTPPPLKPKTATNVDKNFLISLGISADSSQVVPCWEWKNDLDIWVRFTSQQQKILETAWLQNLDEISLPSSRSPSDDSNVVCLRSLGEELMCYRNQRTGTNRDVRRIIITLCKTENPSWLEERMDLSRSSGVKNMERKPLNKMSSAISLLRVANKEDPCSPQAVIRNNSDPHPGSISTLDTSAWRKQNPAHRILPQVLGLSPTRVASPIETHTDTITDSLLSASTPEPSIAMVLPKTLFVKKSNSERLPPIRENNLTILGEEKRSGSQKLIDRKKN